MICRSLGIVVLVFFIGCFGCAEPNDSAGEDHHDGDTGDAHDHDDHSSGPHDGHILELGDEEYHAEWVHDDDTGMLRVYVLDASMNGIVDAQSVTITTQIEGKDAKTYTLEKTTINEEVVFELTDNSLVTALQVVSEGVTAKLNVKIGDRSFEQEFEEHSHHH